jgi:hypothetical protein
MPPPKLAREDMAGFEDDEEEDYDPLPIIKKKLVRIIDMFHHEKCCTPVQTKNVLSLQEPQLIDRVSIASSTSNNSASATLMSSHAMRMGLYTINLGTKMGQKLHTAHMLILPLIPVFILLAQNTATFLQYVGDAEEILQVQDLSGTATILPSENPRIVKYLTREKSIPHESQVCGAKRSHE